MSSARPIVIETRSGPMFPVLSADSTATGTSLSDPADTLTDPTVTPPSNVGVLSLSATSMPASATSGANTFMGGNFGPNGLKLIPFGTTTATQTFLMGVYAIERLRKDAQVNQNQWLYHLLASFTCTLCTKTGITGGTVDASHLYCDTITILAGGANVGVSVEIFSPGSNQAGHVVVDTKGAELVAVNFARNGSSSANNALAGRL